MLETVHHSSCWSMVCETCIEPCPACPGRFFTSSTHPPNCRCSWQDDLRVQVQSLVATTLFFNWVHVAAHDLQKNVFFFFLNFSQLFFGLMVNSTWPDRWGCSAILVYFWAKSYSIIGSHQTSILMMQNVVVGHAFNSNCGGREII